MSDRTEQPLPLDDAENCKCWLCHLRHIVGQKTSRMMRVMKVRLQKLTNLLKNAVPKRFSKLFRYSQARV